MQNDEKVVFLVLYRVKYVVVFLIFWGQIVLSVCVCVCMHVCVCVCVCVCVFHSIVTATGLDIGQKVSDTLGYCAKSKRIFPGLLAEATAPIIQEELVNTLVAEGVEQEKAAQIIRESWFEGDTGSTNVVKSVANLKTLFEILKQNDVKVAICTADNRRGTMNTLRNLNLTK